MDRRYRTVGESLRRLQAYEKILSTDTTLVLSPDSELLRYLQSPAGRWPGRRKL
jgi:hypothetical protein